MTVEAPPDLSAFPVNSTRKQLAEIISKHFFAVSARSLERWPLRWQHVNGKAITPTLEGVAEARRRLEAAPVIRGGRQPATASAGV
jgi:hypothetical protein